MRSELDSLDQRIERMLKAPDVSYWLKDAIKKNQTRDPGDALNDARALLDLMELRCDVVQEEWRARFAAQ